MKQIWKGVIALAALLFATSCQNEELFGGANVDTDVVTYSITTQDLGTRAEEAAGRGKYADKLYYGVYEYVNEKWSLVEKISATTLESADDKDPITIKNGHAIVNIQLAKQKNYSIIFWAQNDNNMVDINWANRSMSLKSGLLANQEDYDAFWAYDEINLKGALDRKVSLVRPFAQINIGASDFQAVKDASVDINQSAIVVKKVPTTMDLTNGNVTAYAETSSVNLGLADILDHANWTFPKAGCEFLTLGYILAEAEQTLVDIDLTYTDDEEGEYTNAFTNVPVRRNYRTNIYGQLLTGNAGYEVEITPDFGGDNDILVWDGKTVTEPTQDENGNYQISHPSELAWLAAAVNGTLPAAGTKAGEDETIAPNSYKGKTFILTDDIDLQNHEWTPIGAGGKHFEGIFNGQGHTITGLRITERFGGDRFALFCSLAGSAQIKNVVIDNAYIKYPADGEDCYASAIAGTIYGDILFEGITVKNSTITGNNKVGAIFAHDGSSTKITINDCHVDNCYIASEDLKDGGCVGGLVGYFATGNEDKPNTISNSSVKNTTIVGINSSNNGKRANSLVIGSIKTKATMELNIVNCVLENNTFSQTIDGTAPVTYVGTFNPQYIGGDREEAHLGKITIDGYELIANGVGMKDGEYFVMSAQGLAWVEAQEDKYFAGKTIKLANDIDMTGVTIEKPIHFWNGRTTFDGQNHTISNLTMSTTSTDKKPFGLFGGTADIKNVKFDKANISGYSYVAVVAGNLYGNIDNCHVSNSSVTCTYWMAGAMSGQYNAGNVTNCSVTNTTITGPAAVGALVGNINETAGERKVENCTVTGCTVAQNGSFGGNYDKMFGTAVGLVNISNSKVYINGCKVENTTVKGATSANIFGHNGGDNTTIYVDGYTYTPDGTIKDEDDNLVLIVNSPESLKVALETAGAAGAGNTTIVFPENATLDMTNTEWTPIKVDGYNGADIVTIDGKGATITGLTAPLFAGGFAGGSGIVIKDLTIKNSNIVSANTLGSGAFIESIDSMDKITLTNCHLLNSIVTGGAGSRTGGLIGWTAGYNNENDGPVKTYVTIDNCSVIGCTIQCDGSVGGINGHAGNNAWTYTTIKNCTVQNNILNSTDDGEWRTGVVVGTANVGEVTISNITESGNTLTQTGKEAPTTGYKRNYYGRFVGGSTGKLIIDGCAIANTQESLLTALADEEVATVYLGEGKYVPSLYNNDIPTRAELTIIGAGADKTQFAYTGSNYAGQFSLTGFDRITIRDCEILKRENVKDWGMVVFGSSNNANGVYTIENCTFNGVGTQGIFINENTSGAVYNILDCTFNGDFGNEGAITIQNNTNVNHTVNVQGCTFNNIPESSHKIYIHYNYTGWTLNTDNSSDVHWANPNI